MKRRVDQPPRHMYDNINVVACPHQRSYEEIQRDLVQLLEAAARRNPDMWDVPVSFDKAVSQ